MVLGGESGGSYKGRVLGRDLARLNSLTEVDDFTENRKRDGPSQFLANSAGYLQADAFSGYDGIYTGSDGRIVEVAYWERMCAPEISSRS